MRYCPGSWDGACQKLSEGKRGASESRLWLARCGQQHLDEVELPQVQLEDGVLDGSEDKADVLCVRGAREVGVDDLLLVRVLVLIELQDKVSGGFDVLLWSWFRAQLEG